MTLRVAAVLVAAGLALAAWSPTAWAHATLERSSPERGAVLERPPGEVRLDFDEPVEAAFGAVRVYDGRGERLRTGPLRRPGGGTALAVALPARLAEGAYTVTYRVVSADGHPVAGGLTFQVGDAAAAPRSDVAALLEREAAGPVSRAALGVARGLGYLAIAAAIGGLAFQVLCRRDAPVGPLIAGGIALGVAAGAAALVLQAAVAGATSAGRRWIRRSCGRCSTRGRARCSGCASWRGSRWVRCSPPGARVPPSCRRPWSSPARRSPGTPRRNRRRGSSRRSTSSTPGRPRSGSAASWHCSSRAPACRGRTGR